MLMTEAGEEGRRGGGEEGRKGGREEGRKGGREEGRKGGRKGGRVGECGTLTWRWQACVSVRETFGFRVWLRPPVASGTWGVRSTRNLRR